MYAIIKTVGPNQEDRGWAEWDGEGNPVAHETRESAEASMRRMVPEGKDPAVYAGLSVVPMLDIGFATVEE
jgi:hypothetical protein